MLLCGIDQIDPGMLVAAPVRHPRRPSVELLRPGVALDARLLHRLAATGVAHVWVHHDATSDLDHAAVTHLSQAAMNVYAAVTDTFNDLSSATFFTGSFQTYRSVVMDLITEVVASGNYGSLTAQLLANDPSVFAHSTRVAYLAVLVGLELEGYVVRERNMPDVTLARDLTNLGLGALLHDIGKLKLSAETHAQHEVHLPRDLDDDAAEEYRQHTSTGFQMLSATHAPATMVNTILHHHQRFDGEGWPDMHEWSKGRRQGPQIGREIHIFSRIVAATNVLDNLTLNEDGTTRPLVAALHDFAQERFDGWFDPVVRQCILRRVAPFPVGSHVVLDDGTEAVVVSPNLAQPWRPVVRPLACVADEGCLLDLDQSARAIVTWAGVDVRPWHYELEAKVLVE